MKEQLDEVVVAYPLRTEAQPLGSPLNCAICESPTQESVFEHSFSRGRLKIVFPNVRGLVCTNGGHQFPYPGHVTEILSISETIVNIKRGILDSDQMKQAATTIGADLIQAIESSRLPLR